MTSRSLIFATLAFGVAASAPVVAAESADLSDATPVVVVVEVPRPWYAPDFLIARKMRQSLPTYRSIPGLRYKAFTLARPSGDFGGIYLWQDRASADAWFTPAWYQRIRDQYDVEAKVRMFQTDGIFERAEQTRQAEHEDDAVATLIDVAGAHDRSAWAALSPQERTAPGLLRLYEISAPDGSVGRVYLWRDRDVAERWFDAAWHARMRTIDHRGARIEWFDVPVLMPAASAQTKAAP